MNSALSNLTEAYTDSENEDNNEESEGRSDPEEKQIKAQIIIQPKKNSKHPRRLVSYNDPEVQDDASDEEANHAEAEPEDDQSESQQEEDKKVKYFKKYGFHLPPEPTTKLDQKFQDNVTNLFQKISNSDFDLNQYIQDKKEFRNPSIYDKLIQFCDINELGTNFPPEIFDVSIYGPESFYEELAKAQKTEMDKLEKQKKEASKTNHLQTQEAIKRKSKWDQQAPSSASGAAPSTNSVSSAKTIIISSTGSLKKPKM
jgi:hypothetical protein